MHTLKYKKLFMNLLKRLNFKEYIYNLNVVCFFFNAKIFKTKMKQNHITKIIELFS